MSELLEAKTKASVKKQSGVDLNAQENYKPAKTIKEKQEELFNPEDFYDDKMQKDEFKEEQEKIELEKENYKISSLTDGKKENMEVWETVDGWKKDASTAIIDWKQVQITVLKKQIDGANPNAFVREYLDDGTLPIYLIWEQLFSRNAVVNLWLEKKLPSYKQMQTQRLDNYQEFFIKKAWKNVLPGWWDADNNYFDFVNWLAACWVSDGDCIVFNEDKMNHGYSKNPSYGFSVRLLKQK